MLTPHARVRMQQRGIRGDVLDALLDFGAERHVQDGREIVFLDKSARAKLARNSPEGARAAQRLKGAYAIVDATGVVITVGHRFRRIPRD